jgi:histidine triad (HIT) family protein
MQDSIYTKIIKGEIPSFKIYEDEKTIAFLDIHPIQPGMVLVVPKNQVENFMDLPDDDYLALWQTVRKVANRIRQVFPDKKRIGMQVEGLEIPHVHVKLFPIDTPDEFHNRPNAQSEPDTKALSLMAAKLSI